MAGPPKSVSEPGTSKIETAEVPIAARDASPSRMTKPDAVGRVRHLSPEQLYRRADISGLPFATTADLQPIDGLIGQQRALDAINFGTRIDRPGFNLFVIGPSGARMQEAVKSVLREEARARPSSPDWIYVNNFQDADRPIAIELPVGRARKFAAATHELIEDLKTALPAVFQSDDYQTRRSAIDEAFQKKQGEAFSALRDKAAAKDVVIVRTPFGFALAPSENGQVVSPEQFHTWPEAKRTTMQEIIQALEKELEHVVRQIPQLERERREEIRKLNRETAKFAVDQQIDEAKAEFADLPRIIEHIERVRVDLIDNVAPFIGKSEDEDSEPAGGRPGSPFDR
jgi:AAA domain